MNLLLMARGEMANRMMKNYDSINNLVYKWNYVGNYNDILHGCVPFSSRRNFWRPSDATINITSNGDLKAKQKQAEENANVRFCFYSLLRYTKSNYSWCIYLFHNVHATSQGLVERNKSFSSLLFSYAII